MATKKTTKFTPFEPARLLRVGDTHYYRLPSRAMLYTRASMPPGVSFAQVVLTKPDMEARTTRSWVYVGLPEFYVPCVGVMDLAQGETQEPESRTRETREVASGVVTW